MSSFLRLPVVGILAAGLFGCASNCNPFSMSTLCSAELLGLVVLTAPVMVPYTLAKDQLSEAERKAQERKLEDQVKAGDLVASEDCIFTCNEYWEEGIHLATDKVIGAYGDVPDLTPRQQAVLFSAHAFKSRLLKRKDPDAQRKHLDEVFQIGQSEAMWNYVKRNDNDLPRNDTRFKRDARDAFIDFVMLEHKAQIAATGNPKLPMTCELSNYQTAIKLSGNNQESLCETAQFFWKHGWR